MSAQTSKNFRKSLIITTNHKAKTDLNSQGKSITPTSATLNTPVKYKLQKDKFTPVLSEQKMKATTISNTSKEIVQGMLFSLRMSIKTCTFSVEHENSPSSLDKIDSPISAKLKNSPKKHMIKLRKLVSAPKGQAVKKSTILFSLYQLELQKPSSEMIQSHIEPDERNKNESEQLDSLSKIPSYLVPTYSALQYKKTKSETKVEKGFAFGRAKGKMAELFDWASTSKEQAETFPNKKHQCINCSKYRSKFFVPSQ